MNSCDHSWVYSNTVLTSNPPQVPVICAVCGKQENLRFNTSNRQPLKYEETVKYFEDKKKEVTNG